MKCVMRFDLAIICMLFLASCKRNPLSPGLEFMPDMYRHPSIRSYEERGDTTLMRKLPEGVIPLGTYVNPFPNTPQGYEQSASLKNPLPLTDSIIQIGKFYYEKMCIVCHGESGQGNGSVVEVGGFPPPPSFLNPNLMNLPEGKMFHSITYGKNLMPSYSYQVPPYARWAIIHYIKNVLQDTTKKKS